MVKELKNLAEKIDTGNSNLTEEEAMDVLSVIAKEALSKEQACIFLNLRRSRFDELIREGKIPKGKKRVGYSNLIWYKSDLIKAKVAENKSSN